MPTDNIIYLFIIKFVHAVHSNNNDDDNIVKFKVRISWIRFSLACFSSLVCLSVSVLINLIAVWRQQDLVLARQLKQ